MLQNVQMFEKKFKKQQQQSFNNSNDKCVQGGMYPQLGAIKRTCSNVDKICYLGLYTLFIL